MKDLHLDSGGPPGQHGGASGWRAVTRVLRSTGPALFIIRGTFTDLTNTLLPSDCRVCAAPMVAFGRVRVCEDCISRLAPSGSESDILCSRCGDALGMESARFGASLGISECTLCRLAPPGFTRAVAFANYDNEMREMLHLLKFEQRRNTAKHVLGQRLAEAVRKLRSQATADLIVIPVPLFASRERARGFNQALLLAQAAVLRLRKSEPAWALQIKANVVQRIRDTHALYVLNPSQRRRNLRGAFRVVNPAAIAGREVLLIDDIMTTGATARECSRVLLSAGAARIWVATVARAQPESTHNVATNVVVATWDVTPASKPRTIEPDVGRRRTF